MQGGLHYISLIPIGGTIPPYDLPYRDGRKEQIGQGKERKQETQIRLCSMNLRLVTVQCSVDLQLIAHKKGVGVAGEVDDLTY